VQLLTLACPYSLTCLGFAHEKCAQLLCLCFCFLCTGAICKVMDKFQKHLTEHRPHKTRASLYVPLKKKKSYICDYCRYVLSLRFSFENSIRLMPLHLLTPKDAQFALFCCCEHFQAISWVPIVKHDCSEKSGWAQPCNLLNAVRWAPFGGNSGKHPTDRLYFLAKKRCIADLTCLGKFF